MVAAALHRQNFNLFLVTTALVLLLRFATIFSLFVMTKIAIEAKSVMDKSCRCTQERRKRL